MDEQKKHLLIMEGENNPTVQGFLEDCRTYEGIESFLTGVDMLTVHSTSEFLEKVKEGWPDLIITNLRYYWSPKLFKIFFSSVPESFPDFPLEGYETIYALRNAGVKTPIIVYTGTALCNSSNIGPRELCFMAGADAYVEKGVHPPELLDTIKQYLK